MIRVSINPEQPGEGRDFLLLAQPDGPVPAWAYSPAQGWDGQEFQPPGQPDGPVPAWAYSPVQALVGQESPLPVGPDAFAEYALAMQAWYSCITFHRIHHSPI